MIRKCTFRATAAGACRLIESGGEKRREIMAESSFFTYKGVPLVRSGKTIYFGNMYDEYVVMIEILGTKKVGGMDVADKLRIRKMATDITLPPKDQIVKKAEKESLYEALDIACAWLKV